MKRGTRRSPRKIARGTELHFIAFISPWIVGMLVIVLGPMALSFYWSHTDYNIVWNQPAGCLSGMNIFSER